MNSTTIGALTCVRRGATSETSRVVAFTKNSYVNIIQCANVVSSPDRFFSCVLSSYVRYITDGTLSSSQIKCVPETWDETQEREKEEHKNAKPMAC